MVLQNEELSLPTRRDRPFYVTVLVELPSTVPAASAAWRKWKKWMMVLCQNVEIALITPPLLLGFELFPSRCTLLFLRGASLQGWLAIVLNSIAYQPSLLS